MDSLLRFDTKYSQTFSLYIGSDGRTGNAAVTHVNLGGIFPYIRRELICELIY